MLFKYLFIKKSVVRLKKWFSFRGVFRNMYKGHMDNSKGRVRLRMGGSDGWGGEEWWGKMKTTLLEQ